MKKRIGLAAVWIFLFIASLSFSAEKEILTEGDVAVLLVRAMALEREVPQKDKVESYLNLLDSKGIQPLEGWKEEDMVTNGDLAVILVKALNLEEELLPPQAIVERNRDYIQKVWEMQYRIDLFKEPIERLFTDKRFFPEGQPLCPYNFKYTDEDRDNLVDDVEIMPGAIEKDLAVKYLYLLKEKGMAFEGPSEKILRFQEVIDILQSPLFRSTPGKSKLLHKYNKGEVKEEGEEAAAPLSPGGP